MLLQTIALRVTYRTVSVWVQEADEISVSDVLQLILLRTHREDGLESTDVPDQTLISRSVTCYYSFCEQCCVVSDHVLSGLCNQIQKLSNFSILMTLDRSISHLEDFFMFVRVMQGFPKVLSAKPCWHKIFPWKLHLKLHLGKQHISIFSVQVLKRLLGCNVIFDAFYDVDTKKWILFALLNQYDTFNCKFKTS